MDPIKIVLENQLTLESATSLVEILSDHDALIRSMALYVLQDKAGRGDERKSFLGTYYDEVQKKVNWTVQAAEDVWAGKYGDNDKRVEALGADYDLVMYQVNATAKQHTNVYIPASGLSYTKDLGGKRYVLKDVPAAGGKMTWYGYPQHEQGDNPYVFSGSGCGYMSFYGAISTYKKYNLTPLQYADQKLTKVTGAKKCPISIWAGTKLLDNEGIPYTWFKGSSNTQTIYNKILSHLSKGRSVIVSLSYKNKNGSGTIDKRYTNYAHYSLLIRVTEDGKKAFLLDSGAKKPRMVDLWDLCDHIPFCRTNPDWSPTWNGWQNSGGVIFINA